MTYAAPPAPYIPVGGTVTLTAFAVSDPTVTTSVTLTIAPLPITIAISTAPPAALGVNATVALAATVTNDDNAAGVNWGLSCGSAACGSLQSGLPNSNQTASTGQILYTAPSSIPQGGAVTITATSVTDPTKSAKATVSIQPIAISVSPMTVTVPVFTTTNLTATVAYDASNQGVTWGTPTCGAAGACGSLSAAHSSSGTSVVYSAPTQIPTGSTVSIVAASTANPTATATVTITIAPPPPIAVTVAPVTASVQASGTLTLTASEAYDQANAGADWTLSCATAGACGSLTAHTSSGTGNLYTAPSAARVVTATATSTTDKTKSGAATITVVPAISIAFTPPVATSVTAGTATSFTATITNEITAAGVDWTASCAAAPCGTFSPVHTLSGAPSAFTAPIGAAAGTVTITATSTASNTALPVRSASTKVTVTPVIAVNFVPYAPSQMQVSSQLNGVVTSTPVSLTASVTNDTTNAGVDWSVCSSASACGQFQITPAVAATSTTQAVNAVYAATVHTASGQAAFYVPPSQPPSSGSTVSITAQAHNPAATSSLAKATAVVNVVATPGGLPLNGVVMAGATPVIGAAVSLYAAGTTGYSSAATPLAISGSATQVFTGTKGQFTIPAGYTCPAQDSQMYLVSLGGNAGGGVNPNLAMMTALGPCGGLNSTVNITIDEVTTIGSIWPLAPFMSDYAHVGSSSTNATAGLANAFATVNNLVNISTGQALAVTPPGSGTVPQAEINTLADILNTCSITAGGAVGDGSPCGVLFGYTNPTAATSTAPVDTVRSALNIAQSPQGVGNQTNTVSVFNLLPTIAQFYPALSVAPNDWTIALNFTGGGLGTRSTATSLAIDASGDVWITNNRYSSVTELNSLGAPLSPAGTTAGGYQGGGLVAPLAIAIDPFGNAWIANGSGSLTELNQYGVAVSGTTGYTGGGLTSQNMGLAIDGRGNVWTVSGTTPGSVSWFAGANATINGTSMVAGTAVSPASGFSQGMSSPTGAIGIDTSGVVWVLNSGNNSAAEFTSSTGSFIQSDYGYQQTVPISVNSALSQGVGSGLVIDGSGNVFAPTGNPPDQLSELFAGGSSSNAGGLGAAYPSIQSQYSQFLALDGAGHVWLLITGSNTCLSGSQVLDSLLELSSAGIPQNTNSLGCGYRASALSASNTALGVDGSGDVWVLASGSVTEFIGVAAPAVTPLSLGVQNKTLGKKP